MMTSYFLYTNAALALLVALAYPFNGEGDG